MFVFFRRPARSHPDIDLVMRSVSVCARRLSEVRCALLVLATLACVAWSHTPAQAQATDRGTHATTQAGDAPDPDDLDVTVVPNPYIAGEARRTGHPQRVVFVGLPSAATIRIYNITGNLLRTLTHEDGDDEEEWDLRTEYGQLVASGNYYFHVTAADGRTDLGRLAVVH